MRAAIQSFLLTAGESACYALDIVQLAEIFTGVKRDLIDTLEQAIDKRYIKFNYHDYDDDDNFFVMNPAGMLSWLTGKVWTVTKEGADYKAKEGELEVDRWERKKTGITLGHFRLPNWDSLYSSVTVKIGTLVSKRIFRLVKVSR